jgi:Domain of unknown function (DUF4189)/KTSC domain
MKALSLMIALVCVVPSIGRAESVFVKYRGEVDLTPFDCTGIERSSFINRVCYDRNNEYMLISLNGTYYQYCQIDAGTVSSLLDAPSMGQFYNFSIKRKFECYKQQPDSPGSHFGAIAYSDRSGANGYSYDFDSAIQAQERALQACGYDCRVVIGFANACGALAVGAGRGYGADWAEDRQAAEDAAIKLCTSMTHGCNVVRSVCTTR